MWPMNDEDGPPLAKEFYSNMGFQGIGAQHHVVADSSQAAMALNNAVNTLRAGGVPFDRWINFIHFGI